MMKQEYKYSTIARETAEKYKYPNFATETALNTSIRLQWKLWSGIQVSKSVQRKLHSGDGDQREFDLETRVTTNGNIIISEMFHSCALNK